MKETDRLYWVDWGKLLAIIAVMIDHTNGLLYENQRVFYFTAYSVSSFIILMGVTTWWSYCKEEYGLKKIGYKCWSILRSYTVATFIICCFRYAYFDFEVFLDHLIHFNANGPFYYVFLYIQLLIASPIICYFVKVSKNEQKKSYAIGINVFILIILILIAFLTTNYTNMLSIFGGGGKIFGGTYIILFYFGILWASYLEDKSFGKKVSLVLSILCGVSAISWWQFICINKLAIDSKFIFGLGYNPPSISFIVYSCLMILFVFFNDKTIANYGTRVLKKIYILFSRLGRHTLYIFLYHEFVLIMIIPFLSSLLNFSIQNIWLKRIVYFILMITISLVIEQLLKMLHKQLKRIFQIE